MLAGLPGPRGCDRARARPLVAKRNHSSLTARGEDGDPSRRVAVTQKETASLSAPCRTCDAAAIAGLAPSAPAALTHCPGSAPGTGPLPPSRASQPANAHPSAPRSALSSGRLRNGRRGPHSILMKCPRRLAESPPYVNEGAGPRAWSRARAGGLIWNAP